MIQRIRRPRAPSPYRTDIQVTTAERQQLWKTFFDMAEALEDDDETLEISADNPNQHMDELCLQHKAQVEQMCEEHLQQMDHICVENKYPFTFSQLHQMYQDALSARQVAEAELQSLQTWRILDERAGAEQQANAPEAALRDESSRAQDAADAIARALEEKNQPVITTVRFRPVDAMHPQFRYQIDPFGEDVANGALIKILDKDRSYLMAYAFDQQHVNEDVFNILSPTINNAVANRNVTIVVTAKSGTGKSYFIKNTLPLGVEKLNRHFLATKVDHDYEVEMSVSVEVYGRRIFDLNVPDTTRQTKPARALRTAPSARSWSINSRREKVSEASQMQLEKTIWGSWTPRLTSVKSALHEPTRSPPAGTS